MPQIPDENDRRIARLEAEMRHLRREMAALREAVGAPAAPEPSRVDVGARETVGPNRFEDLRATRSAPQVEQSSERAAASVGDRVAPRREGPPKPASEPSKPLEALIGRYLTLGVGVLTVMFGVGTFLAWAIAHGWLGPTVRVVLGFMGASGIAAFGIRVRASGTREFGNVLIALGLAVTEVVCWYAGPELHVVPSFAALLVALVASAVLAEFALRHDEAQLCAVGFGGAALAPFLAGQAASPWVVAPYGLLVITLSTVALGERPWRGPRLIPLLSIFVYVIALISTTRPLFDAVIVFGTVAWARNALPLLFACAVLAAMIPAASAAHRRMLLRAVGGALILSSVALSNRPQHGLGELGILIAASVVTLAFLDLTKQSSTSREATLDAGFLPMVLLGAALGLTSGQEMLAAGIALAWSAGGFFATSRSRGEAEAEPWAWTAAFSLLLVPVVLQFTELANIAMAFVGVSVVLTLVDVRLPRAAFLLGPMMVLYVTSLAAWILLNAQGNGVVTDSLLRPNVVALLVLLGWWIAWKVFGSARDVTPPDETAGEGLTRAFGREVRGPGGVAAPLALVSGLVAAFFFVRADFIAVFAPPTITSLLILYYGSVGVITIAVGRKVDSQPARLVGLALTLFAAGKVLLEALAVPNVAVRVALFFAVSAFLIGIAYWYRRDASTEPSTEDEPVELEAAT